MAIIYGVGINRGSATVFLYSCTIFYLLYSMSEVRSLLSKTAATSFLSPTRNQTSLTMWSWRSFSLLHRSISRSYLPGSTLILSWLRQTLQLLLITWSSAKSVTTVYE
ncbi:hypothetical protein BJX66DRAFT_204949 [Aspergillus keveii]|uniref:Uncharacterized protein n=1 Tax=Aspergillus keveii TaxID=714993 RepID=A0ABR4G528_9EURO